MAELSAIILNLYVEIIANLGLLALAAWGISYFQLIRPHERWKLAMSSGPKVGLLFGLTACLVMLVPIELEPGLSGDARGAPVLLAGMVGGPIAALIAAALAIVGRAVIAFPSLLADVVYTLIFAGLGVAWRAFRIKRRRRDTTLLDMVMFTAAASMLAMPTVFLLPEDAHWISLVTIWPILAGVTIMGGIVLTFLLRRDVRTRDLIVALEQQKRSAEQGQRAKSTFLANMSHELRTPLNAILGFAEILSKDQLKAGIDPRYKSYAEDIRSSGEHLLSLLNDILDLSKIEAGKYEANPKPLKLAELWPMPLANSKMLARRRMITILSDEIDPELTIVADLRGLQQCLLNVIGNAIKYSPEGGTVTCRSVRHQDMVELVVEDTGPGIPPEDMDRVLQPFEQTRSRSTLLKPEGTGLGLAITQSLLQLMQGTLEIQSQVAEPGHESGTRVSLFLPLDKEGTPRPGTSGGDR